MKTVVTLADIRAQLGAAMRKNVWDHALAVVDIIESKAAGDLYYADIVDQWLQYPECSTVWLRDEVMEPLRHLPEIVQIGKKFNPTTEWHNTWMPLDAAMHRARNEIDPEEW